MMLKISKFALALLAALSLGTNARATTIYDNSVNDLLTRFNPGLLEVGDQIVLAGTERFLTNFSFEYYATNTANPSALAGANVEARVRFYLNDGVLFNGYATPGTMFYDSGLFSVGLPTDRSTFVFTAGSDFAFGGLYIPANEITWSVQFSGLGGTDEVGVDIYSPPVVGANYPDYWENNAGWSLKTNTVPMNFAAQFQATVPEPSALTLLAVAGLGFLCTGWRLRKH